MTDSREATPSGCWSTRLVVSLLGVTLCTTATVGVAAAQVTVTSGTVFEASDDGPTVEISETLTLDSPYDYPDGQTVDLAPKATFESDGDTDVTVERIDGEWTELTTHDVAAGLEVDPHDKQAVTIEGDDVSAFAFRNVDVETTDEAALEYTADDPVTVTLTDLPAARDLEFEARESGEVIAEGTTDGDGTFEVTLDAATDRNVVVREPPSGDAFEPAGVLDPDDADEVIDVPADTDVEHVEEAETDIESTTGETVVDFSEGSVLDRIELATALSADVAVAELDGPPAAVQSPPGTPVTVVQIEPPERADGLAATLTLDVPADHLDDASADNIRVSRFADGKWHPLDFDVDNESEDELGLTVETPGFSYFAVSSIGDLEAAFDVIPADPTAGEELTLDASESVVENGDVETVAWDIGGDERTGERVTTTIEQAGDVDVNLTVTTADGRIATVTETVTVTDEAPNSTSTGTTTGHSPDKTTDQRTDRTTRQSTDGGTERPTATTDRSTERGSAKHSPDESRTEQVTDNVTSADGPGFGAVVAVLTLLILSLVSVTRR